MHPKCFSACRQITANAYDNYDQACKKAEIGLFLNLNFILLSKQIVFLFYKPYRLLCLICLILMYVCMYVCMYVSLGTLVPNSRDQHEKMATEFFALQNTP